jgi:hypothetical protein
MLYGGAALCIKNVRVLCLWMLCHLPGGPALLWCNALAMFSLMAFDVAAR